MKSWPGWVVWGVALAGALLLPGGPWKHAPAPQLPWAGLLGSMVILGMLGLASLGAAWVLGPGLSRSGSLTILDAVPEFLWGALVLALWPRGWEAPGWAGLGAAFLLAALPGEVRWLGQALPVEAPFPKAWGRRVVLRARRGALAALAPRWLAARLPVWITATLVLERILGLPGLGSDWMERVARRDHLGMALWIAFLAGLWSLLRRGEGPR
ncbi:MAG: hypothetical protein HY823_07040 [Acidobacteria bacterium]|nr:hypothetical protein [Acidobacteriota bacterium]